MLKGSTLKQANIPDYLKGLILEKCPYCDSEIYYSYSLDEIRCTNKKCQAQIMRQLEYLKTFINFGSTDSVEAKIKENNITLNEVIEELGVEVPLVYYMRALGIAKQTPHLLNTLLNAIMERYTSLEDFLKVMQEQESEQSQLELLQGLISINKNSDILQEEIIALYIELCQHQEDLKNLTPKIKVVPLENITLPSNITAKVKDKRGNYCYNIGYNLEKSTQYYVDNGNNNFLKNLAKEQGIQILTENKYYQK